MENRGGRVREFTESFEGLEKGKKRWRASRRRRRSRSRIKKRKREDKLAKGDCRL